MALEAFKTLRLTESAQDLRLRHSPASLILLSSL